MTFYKSAEQYYSEMTSTEKEVDTSEHSLIYKSNMPISMELSYHSLLMDELEKKIYAKSALDNKYYDNLIKRCRDIGLEKTLGDYASGIVTMKGTKGAILPKGSYVATKFGKIYITFAELILDNDGEGKVLVIANEKGSSYNAKAGDICSFPVEYKGIDFVVNEEEISNGYDDETYESLYNRYLLKVQTPATSGNKYHYEQWALEVTGVGSAKCIPGAGIVRVIIANSNKRAASKELIKETYDHIDEVRPLLAGTLEVITVKEIPINITGNVEIDTSVTLGEVQTIFKELVETYLDDKVYETKKVNIAKIQSLLIDIDGVSDYEEVKINGNTSNISLEVDEIAVLQDISLGVM